MDLGKGLGHLTYSTLVHPADDWPQLWDSLQRYLPPVKQRISPNAPFGVCIRLSHLTAAELSSSQAERDKLKAFLQAHDLYVYTANAFVYGVFKNTQIKEQVYEPDWRTNERREYTRQVADILADICPAFATPSIQTAPLGFKPRVTGPDVVEAFTENVLQVCAHLVHLEQTTGKLLTLGLEPEPRCYLETTDETITYFQQHLYTAQSARRLQQLAKIPMDTAIAALRRHLDTSLPAYARPVFLRVRAELETTATFKHRKDELVRAGYDPAATDNAIYWDDVPRQAYARVDKALFERINSGQTRI